MCNVTWQHFQFQNDNHDREYIYACGDSFQYEKSDGTTTYGSARSALGNSPSWVLRLSYGRFCRRGRRCTWASHRPAHFHGLGRFRGWAGGKGETGNQTLTFASRQLPERVFFRIEKFGWLFLFSVERHSRKRNPPGQINSHLPQIS